MQRNECFVQVSITDARVASDNGQLVHWRPDESLEEEKQYASVFAPFEGFEIK